MSIRRARVWLMLLSVALAATAVVSYEFRRAGKITVSVSPLQPVYTVGRVGDAKKIASGEQVIRYGPMFWGLYPGVPAFRTPGTALKFLEDGMMDRAAWQVYLLSGEYDLDVDESQSPNRVNKSLAVVETVRLGS